MKPGSSYTEHELGEKPVLVQPSVTIKQRLNAALKFLSMKKILILILILILTFTLISCEWDRKPVQEVTPAKDIVDIIAYAPGEYEGDSTYYCLG